jgi:hypothetical protein
MHAAGDRIVFAMDMDPVRQLDAYGCRLDDRLIGGHEQFRVSRFVSSCPVLLLARHRWALIVPSLYGAIAFVWVVVAWVISAGPFMRNLRTGSSPVPAERLVPSPDLLLLALGAALGIIASWRDFFAAIRLVATRDRAGSPEA